MPARKPQSLITKHETAAEQAQRARGESQFRSRRQLSNEPPARLKGHKVAAAAWRRIMHLYNEIQGEIVTRLDIDHLVDYCLLLDQLSRIDRMSDVAYQTWEQLAGEHERLIEAGKPDEAVRISIQVVGAFDAVTKLDARADRKRDLLLKWRQSLYLTSRSRAGVVPVQKEPVEPPVFLETRAVLQVVSRAGEDAVGWRGDRAIPQNLRGLLLRHHRAGLSIPADQNARRRKISQLS